MSHSWVTAMSLISIAVGAAAALLLYWGSLGVQWKLRSWTGDTAIEKRYDSVQRLMAWVGIPCVFIAAGCQAAIVLFAPD
jgi:hypothetical protein